jgi:hypothetical protein
MESRKAFVTSIMAGLLACLIVGCGDAQQKNAQREELPDLTGTSDTSAPADSSATGSAAPAYTINGKRVQPGKAGADGIVSLLASVNGDLNEDGRDDHAVIIILKSVGSGVFYHLNVFLDDGKGEWRFVGEEFLGDRIRFDFLDIYAEGSVSLITGVPIHPDDYGQLVVAFFARSREQSFAEEPSLYLTRHWKVEDGGLVLIEDY